MEHDMFGYDHGGWMFGGGGLWMLLMWLIPIALVIWLISSRGDRPSRNSAEKTALDILKERYARSEINQDEFEQKKRHLSD